MTDFREEIQEHPATGFDVDAWLQDAHLPEESAEVYKRGDVVAELTVLRSKIELERKAAAGAERTAGDADALTELENQYEALVETFAQSQLTIYTRALSPDEKVSMRAAHEERVKDLDKAEQDAEYGYDVLSAAIVAVRPFEGERTVVRWSPEQVRTIEGKIGGAQMSQVLKAYQLAQNRVPLVDADFLRKPSGAVAGQS